MKTDMNALLMGLLALGLAANAQATLLGRLPVTAGGADYQAYYDTTTNLTWLADANYAGTTMTWSDANNWAAGLNIDGVTGWRLPDTNPVNGTAYNYSFSYDGSTDVAYNVSAPDTIYAGSMGSEMAYLFYDTLGNVGNYDASGNPTGCSLVPPYCLTNTGPFSNVQSDNNYWSATQYTSDTYYAWIFAFGSGLQAYDPISINLYAWAVHAGDVAAGVPEPGTAWLMGIGMAGLLGLRRRTQCV